MTRRYLKNYCNSEISWGEGREGDHIEIPDPLPIVKDTFRQKVPPSSPFHH